MDELRPKLITLDAHNEKPARKRRLFCAAVAIGFLAAACDRGDDLPATTSTAGVAPASTDSGLSMDESIRRFRTDLPAVQVLEGGSTSRDGLVAAFVRAVEENDTAGVRRLHVSRAEYAYLYFPSSIYVNEPYRQPPQIAWLLSSQSSEKGITRVLRRLGGHDLDFGEYECAQKSSEGENTFWRSCMLDYLDPQERTRVQRRLFGSIIERGGQYKFLSYANDL